MNVLICDDEALCCERLQRTIQTFFAAKDLPVSCTVCTSAEQVLQIKDPELFQLAFLDVDLVTMSGIELGRYLKAENPQLLLVYVSAYLDYAPQGYTVSAFRYILKRDLSRDLPQCMESVYAELFQKTRAFTVEINRESRSIPYDGIFYLESAGRRVQIFGERLHEPLCSYYGKLSDLPQEMLDYGFLRIGKSTVVNMRYIRRIAGYKAILCNNAELSVSRAHYGEIRSAYLEWKGRFGNG